MKLIETRTYKIDMASTEREHFEKLSDELDAIEHLFIGKMVFYTDSGDDRCAMDMDAFEQVIEFLYALSEDKVEVQDYYRGI